MAATVIITISHMIDHSSPDALGERRGGAGQSALLDLLTWTSPAWPIGAFAFSGGLEWACEAGYLPDALATRAWIETLLVRGIAWNDAVLFVHAYRAASDGDRDRLNAVCELACACATSAERRMETTAQGAAFRRISRSTFSAEAIAALDGIEDNDLAYPVAFACLSATRAVPVSNALAAYLHGLVANLVSAAQRLVPLGQTDGQAILHALRAPMQSVVERALALPDTNPFDQIGGATVLAELGTMAHETQYTRLFRT